MRLWTVKYDRHWFFASLFVFLNVLIGYGFYFEGLASSLFNPALGFFFLFVLINGKKAYLWFIPSVLLGHFIMRYFYLDSGFLLSLILAFSLSLILYIQVYLFDYLRIRLNLIHIFSRYSPISLITSIVVVVLVSGVGAYLSTITFIVTSLVQAELVSVFLSQFQADIFGLALISLSGYWSYLHDDEVMSFKSVNDFLFRSSLLIVFTLLVVFITQSWIFFQLERDFYILFIMYMILGLVFNYRIIAKINVLFLFLSAISLSALNVSYVLIMVTLNIFVASATLLALLIKRFIDLRVKQTNSIDQKNKSVDELLNDIYDLLSFSNELIDQMKGDEHEKHLNKTLDIALNLVKDADAGYCYLESNGTMKVINAMHYNKDKIPYIYETHDLFIRSDSAMREFQDVKSELKHLYGEAYGLLVKDDYPMKRRMMMKFDYQKDKIFIVVIDKFENSDVFTSDQSRQLSQFVRLLSGLFKRNYYMSRNMVLKNDIIINFVKMLDLFDSYTKGHSEDVSSFVTLFGEALNLNDDDLEALYWAGILHDIGKIGVPSKILNKPNKLTAAEYKLVKHHANYGYDVLNKSDSLKPIAKLIKHHHEWWNGFGYPDQLKEEDIPLGSQIISVADMISTMATDRTYRKRQTKKSIIEELIRYRGTQFSPKVVDIALKLIDDGLLENQYGRSF